jgi:hypothetical protein
VLRIAEEALHRMIDRHLHECRGHIRHTTGIGRFQQLRPFIEDIVRNLEFFNPAKPCLYNTANRPRVPLNCLSMSFTTPASVASGRSSEGRTCSQTASTSLTSPEVKNV